MNNNVLLIYSKNESLWQSCRVITPNLVLSYKQALKGNNIIELNYSDQESDVDLYQNVKELVGKNITEVYFVDHQPHPRALIMYLEELISPSRYHFHVYGDFMIFLYEWNFCEQVLLGKDVSFFCASKAQADLVSSFILNDDIVSVVPFSYDSNVFYQDESIRSVWRGQYDLEEEALAFCYTGRLSKQKNIEILIRAFALYKKLSKANSKLFLAGQFDDLGVPYLNKSSLPFFHFQKINSLMNSIDPDLRRDIYYLGNVSAAELNKIYNGSDCYVSVSQHNDEDFGMAPLEAFATGARGILTAWGGYRDFNIASSVEFVPITIQKGKVGPVFQNLVSKFSIFQSQEKSFSRKEIAVAFQNRYCIKEVAASLHNSLNRERSSFKGFSELFFRIVNMVESGEKHFFKSSDDPGYFNDLYEEVYQYYVD